MDKIFIFLNFIALLNFSEANSELIRDGWYAIEGFADKEKIKPINAVSMVSNIPEEEVILDFNEECLTSLVSVSQLDEDNLILANYKHLMLLNLKTNKVFPLKLEINLLGTPEKFELDAFTEKSIYMPTGVFFAKNNLLYIANYKGNNILEAKVNLEKRTVTIIRTFLSVNTKGPENVSVDADRGVLVSANYDAGTITAFDLKNRQELWVTEIGQAHGVAISGGSVYATGLTDRKIYELSLSDGKLTQSKGKLGWNPLKSEFIWPTSVYSYRNNEIVVSDAQSGFISFLDKKNLSTIKYTGGNGPSYEWMNYPYAAVPIKNGMVILSSMRGSIILLNENASRIRKNFVSMRDYWPKLDYSKDIFGAGWKGYVHVNGPIVKVRGTEYRLGFSHLHPILNGTPILRLPNSRSLYNLAAYIYFLQGGLIQENVSYFFSSSSPTLIGVVSQKSKPDVLLSEEIKIDSWRHNGLIINSDGVQTSESCMAKRLERYAQSTFSVLSQKGWLSYLDIYHGNNFLGKVPYKDFRVHFDRIFSTYPGRRFKLAYDACSKTDCDVKKLRDWAREYYASVRGEAYLNMDEYVLVGMISGLSSEGETSLIEYDDCGEGLYYQGHGLNCLEKPTSSSYLSAQDLHSSTFCISKNTAKKVNKMRFGWLSNQEIPQSMILYGLEKGKKKILKKIEIKDVNEDSGYLFSTIGLHNLEEYDRYQIKIIRGGAQNRLLLRSFEMLFDNVDKTGLSLRFDDCGLYKYHKNHDTDVFYSPNMENYLSSLDFKSSGFCFYKKNSEKLNALRLVWYSKEEVPKQIAVYGINIRKGHNQYSLIRNVKIHDPIELLGYAYSTVLVESPKKFDGYMVKLVEGRGQNRLLIRSVDPLFKASDYKDKTNTLLRTADAISKSKNIGKGDSSFFDSGNAIDCRKINAVIKAKNWHCGNFAFMFACALPNAYKRSIVDIHSVNSDAKHSVVAVSKGKKFWVADPMLGAVYSCSISQLIDGSCDYDRVHYLTPINPILHGYLGGKFYYGAKVAAEHKIN